MFFRVFTSILLSMVLAAALFVMPAHADPGEREQQRTGPVNAASASPLEGGAHLPSWLPRTSSELVPLGLALALMGGGYIALRRSTGINAAPHASAR